MPWWGSNKPKLLETAEFSIIEDITITPIEIGRGSYGTVYAAVYDGKPCVAKEMHPYLNQPHQGRQNASSPLEIFFKEINTLSTLKHPSIVQFLGVYFKYKSHVPILVMERMWKNLCSILEERPNQLPLLIKTHILYDVACGLQYLHGQKKPVVHRDLSANNVLLTENLEAKIADLGQAKALDKIAGQKLSTAPGNVAHMAPETLKHKPTYDAKLDIFSFGCTVLHLVTEKFPTPTDQFVQSLNLDNSFTKVCEMDRRKEYVDMMASSSSLLKHVAIQCLYDEPASRPTASQICEELEKYNKSLECESEHAAMFVQYKQDKLTIVQRLQSQEGQLEKKSKLMDELNEEKKKNEDHFTKKEEYIATLESQLQDTTSKFDQLHGTSLNLRREKESLQKDFAKQDDINKQLTTTYAGQVDRLRGDVKAKKEEIKAADLKNTELQQELQLLQTKLKEEQSCHSQEKQRILNLEEQVKNLNSVADNHQQELGKAEDMLEKDKENYKLQLAELQNRLETQHKNDLEILNNKCTEKDDVILELQKKLEEKDSKLNKAVENLSTRQDCKAKLLELRRKYEDLKQVNQKRQQEVVQPIHAVKRVTDPGSKLYQQLLELQHVNEAKHQQLQQQQVSYADTFKLQHEKVAAVQAQMSDLKRKSVIQKQQLEEKSYRLSTLESSLNELQESFYSREEKLKSLEEDNATLNKLVDNNDKLQRNLQGDLKSKEESLKRKDEEYQLLKKEHADELNQFRLQYTRQINDLNKDVEMYKSYTTGQGEISTLFKEETQYKADLVKNTEEKFRKLDNELKSSAKAQKNLKRQIKHQELTIKEKTRYIEQLEKKSFDGRSSQYYFNVHWYPYVSLSAKRIGASAVVIKDKVFITGGYQEVSPQGRELDSYLKSLERGNEVFCFHTGKCRCDSIASPVVLGGVASVNGQCVLVSGADGNTLTGNVYVLCEEGSDEQWKKFSTPSPTPRMLPCVCCYGERWLIVCGGYACKEGSNLLEDVNVVELLDITKGEWYTLSEENGPNISTVLCCAVAGQDVYVIGDNKVLRSNSNKLMIASAKKSENNAQLWSEVNVNGEEPSGHFKPFSVVDVNGEPMIIASISGSEDDVTCVLMKDTTDTWRKMSEAVECQHCSAVVVTPTLELLLFGGSEKIFTNIATDMSQKGTLIPTFNLYDNLPMLKSSEKSTSENSTLLSQDGLENVINQPPAISFIGPLRTKAFDHKGGVFQSPIHKVSIVVPPNAIDDGEKVTVHMGATTSGPFDLPEDCKLRSAVVWLGSGSDVVLKRSIAVVVPHSAVFTSPQHHSMMRFLTCEDCEGPRYKFCYSLSHFDIDGERGWVELNKLAMVAIAAGPDYTLDDEGVQCNSEDDYESDDEFHDTHDTFEDTPTNSLRLQRQSSSPKGKTLRMPPARYLAKLFWPRGEIPNSFRVDIYYLQNLPTELYKVNTLYRQAYYEDNGSYPEIVETEFMIDGNGTELKCVLPCSKSSECDCFSGWSVNRMNDIVEASVEKDTCNYKIDPMKFSFKFDCIQAKANLFCCFEFQGAERIRHNTIDQVPACLQKRYHPPNNIVPFVLQTIIQCEEAAVEKQQQQHDMNAHEMDTQEEEGTVMDSHQVKNLL